MEEVCEVHVMIEKMQCWMDAKGETKVQPGMTIQEMVCVPRIEKTSVSRIWRWATSDPFWNEFFGLNVDISQGRLFIG